MTINEQGIEHVAKHDFGEKTPAMALQSEWMDHFNRSEHLELAARKGTENREKGFDLDNAISRLENKPNYSDIARAFPKIRDEIEKKFKEQDSREQQIDVTGKLNRVDKLLNDEFVKGTGDRVKILQMSSELSRIWHQYAKSHPTA